MIFDLVIRLQAWLSEGASLRHVEMFIPLLAPLSINELVNIVKEVAVDIPSATAITQLLKPLAQLKKDAQIYELLGNLYFKLQAWDEARAAYQEALELEDRAVGSYFGLAQIAQQQQNFETARRHLQVALTIVPNQLIFLFQLASCELQLKNWPCAEKLLNEVLQQDPYHLEALSNLGVCHIAQQKYSDAIYCLTTACRIDEKNLYARSNLANCLLAQERYFEASNQYKLYLELAPEDMEAWYQFGCVQMKLGELAAAQEAFQKVLAVFPQQVHALHNLAALAIKRNEVSVALGFYQRVLQVVPQDEIANYMIAALMQNQGVPQRAPATYVKNLFDDYATYFDQHLLQQLHYQTPKLLKMLWLDYQQQHHLAINVRNMLDLGCGTGLIAEEFKNYYHKAIGVDLSPKMLAIARQKNLYQELYEVELVNYLKQFGRPDDFNFDLVVLADVLVYFGDLSMLFKALARLMNPSQQLLLSIEVGKNEEYQLTVHGRYQHRPDDVLRSLLQLGFKHQASREAIIRYQEDMPVKGFLLLCAKE